MATTDLTAPRLREVLDYDKETGIFTWRLNVSSTGRKGAVAGCKTKAGYTLIRVGKKLYLAHRLAFLHVTGEFPCSLLDHQDMVKSNNAWNNLRESNKSQNGQNKLTAQKNNKATGLLGVFWSSQANKWGAKVNLNRKQYHAGFHSTPELAHAAYVQLKRRLHPFGML